MLDSDDLMLDCEGCNNEMHHLDAIDIKDLTVCPDCVKKLKFMDSEISSN